MTRSEILKRADEIINGQREQDYGAAERNFGLIGQLWTVYLDHLVTAQDVANMMTLFKIARIKTGRGTEDSYIDAVGYMACGGEIATEENKSPVTVEEAIQIARENKQKRELLKAIFQDDPEEPDEANDGDIDDVVNDLRNISDELYRLARRFEEEEGEEDED